MISHQRNTISRIKRKVHQQFTWKGLSSIPHIINKIKIKNVRSVARLTLFRWTCIGRSLNSTKQITDFTKACYVRGVERFKSSLHRFWETENESTFSKAVITGDEKSTAKLVQDTHCINAQQRFRFLRKQVLGFYIINILWY